MRLKPPFATLSIIIFSTTLYLMNSGGNPYIYPITKLALYGVSSGNPIIGGILYSFTHIGLKHLMANMFVLAIVGSVIEQRIESKHAFFIFLLSGWISGVIYTILNSDVWVLGASAAICGVIGAGLVIDVKKTILGAVLALYAIPIVVYPTADWIINNFYQSQEKTEIHAVEKIINYSKELKNATGAEKQIILQKINKTVYLLEKAKREKEKLVKGVKTEAFTPTSHIIHIIGASLGVIYLVLFKRESFKYLVEDVNGIIKPRSLLGGE